MDQTYEGTTGSPYTPDQGDTWGSAPYGSRDGMEGAYWTVFAVLVLLALVSMMKEI